MKTLPRRYFSETDLKPDSPPKETPAPVVDEGALARLRVVADALSSGKPHTFSVADLQPDEVVFLGLLHYLGAVRCIRTGATLKCESTGQMGRDVASVVVESLGLGILLFPDWSRRYGTLSDRICHLELLHHMELERLEHSRRMGLQPRVFHVVPVAYAIIKGWSQRRKCDLYLFELNKDWQMYNLVGGKQAPCDDGLFDATLRREIEEELGVDRKLVKLTSLTDRPLDGYSLSGHQGVLSHYPCMLYLAHFDEHFVIGPKNKWFSLAELESLGKGDGPGLMVNPVYLNYLTEKLPGGLAGLPRSFQTPLDTISVPRRMADFVLRHSGWFIAGLGFLAALITLISVLLPRAK